MLKECQRLIARSLRMSEYSIWIAYRICRLVISFLIFYWNGNFISKKFAPLPASEVRRFRHWLQWRHNERHDVSNHQHLDCLFNRSQAHTSKKTSKIHITGLCEGNPPVTSGFPAQRACNAENVSIWWRHHALLHRAYVWIVASLH